MMNPELKLIKPGECRVRIAPSPTGPLHIGTARTALFNFLFAKKNQGNFILRIEDTDVKRSQKKWEKDIIESLKWLGIEWTEGPDIDGKYAPYKQSERSDIYLKYLKKLIAEKKAYYCFCTEEEIEAHRQYLISIGRPPIYSGKCAALSEKEIKKNFKEGKSAIIRFKVPSQEIKFKDLIRGEIKFNTELIGDVAIAKNINSPLDLRKNNEKAGDIQFLYNFVVVVDDFEMEISHVIRGEDHLSNTPKQILIQQDLGFTQPQYAHLPLILGPDRSKLSKRHGATSVADYRKKGYLPEALVNFMALLGWNPGDDREIFSIDSLIKEFSLEKVQKSGAVFNIQKLDSLNGFYIRHKSLDKLTKECIPYLIEAGLIKPISEKKKLAAPKYEIALTGEKISFEYLKKVVALYQERLKQLSEIVELVDFFFKDKLKYPKELLIWKDMTEKETNTSLDKLIKILSKIELESWNRDYLQSILMTEAEKISIRGKKNRGYLLWPLRVALSGKKASAGPFEIAEILGKEKTLKRLREAKELKQTVARPTP